MKKAIAIIAACMALFAVGCHKDEPSATTSVPGVSSSSGFEGFEGVGGSGSTGKAKPDMGGSSGADTEGDTSMDTSGSTGIDPAKPSTAAPKAVETIEKPVKPVIEVEVNARPAWGSRPVVGFGVGAAMLGGSSSACPIWQCGFDNGHGHRDGHAIVSSYV